MKGKMNQLFWSTFQLSACTFGGGFVIIALMRKKFVEALGWIGEEEMMDLTAIAQSSPGPIAVNAAILVGYRVDGLRGALVAACGTVLPPLIIISVISLFYQRFRENAIVSMAMAGMLAGVAAVILDVVIRLLRDLIRKRQLLPLLVVPVAFAALRFWGVNVVVIILVCGVLGYLSARWRKGAAK